MCLVLGILLVNINDEIRYVVNELFKDNSYVAACWIDRDASKKYDAIVINAACKGMYNPYDQYEYWEKFLPVADKLSVVIDIIYYPYTMHTGLCDGEDFLYINDELFNIDSFNEGKHRYAILSDDTMNKRTIKFAQEQTKWCLSESKLVDAQKIVDNDLKKIGSSGVNRMWNSLLALSPENILRYVMSNTQTMQMMNTSSPFLFIRKERGEE